MIKQLVTDISEIEPNRINLNLTNSSGFVVGKQTNFNGPVTIVNCTTEEQQELGGVNVQNKIETVVIRDSVLTGYTNNALQHELHQQKQLYAQSHESSREICGNVDEAGNDTRYYKVESVESKGRSDRGGGRDGHLTLTSLLFEQRFLKIPAAGWLLIFGLVIGVIIIVSVLYWQVLTVVPITQNQSIIGGTHVLYSKRDWNGLPANSTVKIQPPVLYVIISHTAGSTCYDEQRCEQILRNIQKDQMSRTPPFADIASSFLVGGNGHIYEGRGWYYRTPLESFVNNNNYDITFIGDFSVYNTPTIGQVEGVQKLIEFGVNQSYIAPNYVLIGHNASGNGATLSPGVNVYKIIKEWDRFNPNPLAKTANP